MSALSATDFHVLLVLAERDLYGYAILKAVEEESSGAVRPEIGSLYRVLARLMSLGLVEEAPAPTGDEAHRGRARRYYRLTEQGRKSLTADARRLEKALEIVRDRSLLPELSR